MTVDIRITTVSSSIRPIYFIFVDGGSSPSSLVSPQSRPRFWPMEAKTSKTATVKSPPSLSTLTSSTTLSPSRPSRTSSDFEKTQDSTLCLTGSHCSRFIYEMVEDVVGNSFSRAEYYGQTCIRIENRERKKPALGLRPGVYLLRAGW